MKDEDMPSPVMDSGNDKNKDKDGKGQQKNFSKGKIGWVEHDTVARQTRPHMNYLAEFQEVMENYEKKNQELKAMIRQGPELDLKAGTKLHYGLEVPEMTEENQALFAML